MYPFCLSTGVFFGTGPSVSYPDRALRETEETRVLEVTIRMTDPSQSIFYLHPLIGVKNLTHLKSVLSLPTSFHMLIRLSRQNLVIKALTENLLSL